MAFDSGTLPTLRANVRASATQAGLPEDRAEEVVLAVHELAANSVRHGGGTGRLRVWNHTGSLHCRVDDGDRLKALGPDAAPPGAGNASGRLVNSLPCVPAHGLWVVQQIADQLRSLSGSHGTSVVVTFTLPGVAPAVPHD
jgi:anti-sigma regulatory factor (Ser/Thr protein kinase)